MIQLLLSDGIINPNVIHFVLAEVDTRYSECVHNNVCNSWVMRSKPVFLTGRHGPMIQDIDKNADKEHSKHIKDTFGCSCLNIGLQVVFFPQWICWCHPLQILTSDRKSYSRAAFKEKELLFDWHRSI